MMKKCWMMLMALLLCAGLGTAMADDIPLGAGDTVKISVYDHPDLALETRVSEAGMISFPLIGEVLVGGLPATAAERKIAGLLQRGGFLKNAQVNIIVTAAQSQQISVLGAVTRPGRYPIDGRRSMIDILALAGGTITEGSDSVTLLRTRNGKIEKQNIDVIETVRTADIRKNPELMAGDILYVERAPHFYIYGEIQRAGSYRLERGMTVIQALAIGGGLSARGTERGVRIKRRNAAGVLQELTVDHNDLVQADDVVYIRESLF
ncbi:MAG: polysaccharide export protein EpsE [Janthinobacterium lividum]